MLSPRMRQASSSCSSRLKAAQTAQLPPLDLLRCSKARQES